MKRRYQVGYATRDGNTHNSGETYHFLRFAQAHAEIDRAFHGRGRAYFVYDTENPERGDLMGIDTDEYEETYGQDKAR